MSPPVYAWIGTAGGLALVVALDHQWRAFDVRAHLARLSMPVMLGLLCGCLVAALAGPGVGAAFVVHWVTACASVLDTAVVLALLAAFTTSPSPAVLVGAVGLSAIARAGLPSVGLDGPVASWVAVPVGIALLGLGGRLFGAAQSARHDAIRIRPRWALISGGGAVVLFAWTFAHATPNASGYLVFLANMAALAAFRPLFLLVHATSGHGEWSGTGMAVLACFTGAKLAASGVPPGDLPASPGLAALTAVVVATVVGAVALPSLRPGASSGSSTGHPTG